MDFKSPKKRTKNKFEDLDLDDLGEEVVLVDPPVECENAEEAQTVYNGTQTQATGGPANGSTPALSSAVQSKDKAAAAAAAGAEQMKQMALQRKLSQQAAQEQQQLQTLSARSAPKKQCRVSDKRVFICHSQMLDSAPLGFEVNRDGENGEKLRVLYSRPNDRFFQLQESLSETSTFIGDQILKETQVYTVTELNPVFILLPSLLSSQNQQKNRNKSPSKPKSAAAAAEPGENQFESYEQIFTSLNIVASEEEDDEVMEIQNTPCSLDSAALNAKRAGLSLSETLRSSSSLERALCRMCKTREFTHPTNNSVQKLYSFDMDKCMSHFADKYEKIKRHLATRYVQENRGLLLELRNGTNQRRTVLKQEDKTLRSAADVKQEIKSEVKAESAAQQIDPADFEDRFEVMAMGVVADELPQSCVEPFLKYIKANRQSSARLFDTFAQQNGPVKTEEPPAQQQSNPMPINKKRSQVNNPEPQPTQSAPQKEVAAPMKPKAPIVSNNKQSAGVKRRQNSSGMAANQSVLSFKPATKK